MSGADVGQQHATWLALVETAGPFVTLPVLNRRLPQGLDPVLRPDMDRLRLAWSTWDAEQRDPKQTTQQAQAHADWIRHVVTDLLDWHDDADLDPPPGTWEHTEPDTGVLFAASFLLRHPGQDKPFALGFTLDPDDSLTSRGTDGWPATAIDRTAVTLREHGVPLGVVTNGRWWGLVWAPRGGVAAHCLWDAVLWTEDRVTLEAFTTVLGRYRQFSAGPSNTLLAMLTESLDSQEEVTDQLGTQVRGAVEALVDALGRADERTRDDGAAATGKYLASVTDDEAYQAAVTVLMRLVFMLAAEERQLLPADDPVYAAAYSVAGLGASLDQQAADGGEDALEHSTAGWHRLLAAFRVVHDGADHHEFRLPGYGGGLFDPDRHPWLEGRLRDGTDLPPIPVDDRTVRQVVRSLMWLQFKAKGGHESRRVTYRALDVEQIGYVYEGLLDHRAARAADWTLGFSGPNEPEIDLTVLTARASESSDGLAKWLAKKTGKTAAWTAARLGGPAPGDPVREALLASADGDTVAAARALPFAQLLRQDAAGLPVLIPPGRLHVTSSSERGDTGTHYTPRALAEQVVAGALDALVHEPGPLQTLDSDEWRTRPASEVLALRVADIAMGSGAFLVAACRYLADKLIKVVAQTDRDSHADPELRRLWDLLHDPDVGRGDGDELADEALVHARRLITERCLYGADINPLAVEMAKLSLWLITSARHRPFSFLDHRVVAGDSLLGLTTLDQLEHLHVVPARGRRLHDGSLLEETAHVRRRLADAADTRRQIAKRPSTDLREVSYKLERLAAADRMLADLTLLAHGLAGAALAGSRTGDHVIDAYTVRLASQVEGLLQGVPGTPEHSAAQAAVTALSTAWLDQDRPDTAVPRLPVQWLTRFPEIFIGVDDPGFDAVIGNPPFLGGTKITGANGVAYRENLVRHVGQGVRAARADLVAYFFLVADALLSSRGQLGLIATNSVSQGDTREASLDLLAKAGRDFRASVRSNKWPTSGAALEYSVLWASVQPRGDGVLAVADGVAVEHIGSDLLPSSRDAGTAYRLGENKDFSFTGCKLTGMGFTLTPKEAQEFVAADARNREVLAPLLNGEDLNGAPDVDEAPSRWVIDFNDRDETAARAYPVAFERVERLVKPERQRRKANGDFVLRRPLPQRWWQFADKRPALRAALAPLQQTLVLTQTSSVVMPLMVPTGWVISHACVVFATDDFADLALLSSSPHYWWTIGRASTLETRVRYTPSDVFETLARPNNTPQMRHAGEQLDQVRRDFALSRRLGLTATYNLVHDPKVKDRDVAVLRELHDRVDDAVFEAYGWSDLEPDHGHWQGRQGIRWTLSPKVQAEVLARLMRLNHRRYAEEQAATRPGQARLSVVASTQSASLFGDLLEGPA